MPLFYERDKDGLPDRLAPAGQARAWPTSAREIEASRMLKEYTLDYYEPAAARSADMRADHYERAKALVRWRRYIFRGWPSVAVITTTYEERRSETRHALPGHRPGDPRRPRAERRRGAARLRRGRSRRRAASTPSSSPWARTATATCPAGTGYVRELEFDRSGNFGFTVRIVPSHPDLLNPAYLARVAWAPSPFSPANPD